jgi:aryl-alcohol dehydrogenase-like predicted oxidoreductase
MEYANLGNTGLKVSRIGVGCWAMGGHGWAAVDRKSVISAIRVAVESGITLYDTADVYGLGRSEELLSEALGDQRNDMVVSTKFGVTWDVEGRTGRDSSPAYLTRAVEASLRRLRLERIPLYFVHWPDPETPPQETLEAMDRLKRAGKVGALGCSNFSTGELGNLLKLGLIDVVQGACNLLSKENGTVLACQKANVSFMAFDVLCKGLLTGRFSVGDSFPANHVRAKDPNFQGERFRRNLRHVDKLRAQAAERRKSPAQAAIRWVLDRPGVTCALTGVTRPEQVIENIGTLDPSHARQD